MSRNGTKYTRLLNNTLLFGVSTFSSKVLSFLLTRLYTGVLSEASFGTADAIVAAANLLIPLVSLGISHAVIRFGLEKGASKEGVFTGGVLAVGGGFCLLLPFMPLLGGLDFLKNHVLLLYLYVLVSCLRTLCCQFVRARMFTKLYALDGILSTVYTLGFSLLFLVVFRLGVAGYLLAVIAADALSAAGLVLVAGLWRFVSFARLNRKLFAAMLRYSLPLVPALMFWWVTGASDRFFVISICGAAENGLYAAAYKLPTVVTVLSTIFTEAWQLSAVSDGQGAQRGRFFSNVFGMLSGVVFVLGGLLIVCSRLAMGVLVAPDFYPAWEYVPFLVCATVFSCLAAFQNSVYMVEKRSARSLVTMMAGAAANLVLNALLIPLPSMGPCGAALATFLSYTLVFVIRAADTRRFIRIRFSAGKLLLCTALLVAAALVMQAQPALWQLWAALAVACLAALNMSSLRRGFMAALRRRSA